VSSHNEMKVMTDLPYWHTSKCTGFWKEKYRLGTWCYASVVD